MRKKKKGKYFSRGYNLLWQCNGCKTLISELSSSSSGKSCTVQKTSVVAAWFPQKDTILLPGVFLKHTTLVQWDLNQECMLSNSFCRYPHFLEAPQQ
ncbi:hypothetical protein TNCV_2392361 [Trichonephila clavipes]|nr:hypothetical protein TNCV_2392361 [Trichonephila clavipes]